MSKIRQKTEYERRGADTSTYPNQYDNNKNYGERRKVKTKNIVVKNTTSGQVYGYKTVEEGMTDTVYPNAIVIRTKRGEAIGEIYQTEDGDWGCFHYKIDSGYDGIDTKEWAYDELKQMHDEYRYNRNPRGYTGASQFRPMECASFADYLELAKLDEMASKWKVEFDDGTSETVVADDRQHAKLKVKDQKKHVKKITRVEIGTLEEATSEKDTRYPEAVMGEISSLITKGAKDLEQKWKNTFELVHTAFHVANVKRPQYDQKGAWKQYEDMLAHAVKALRKARGANWSGRESGVGWHPDMDITEDMCATPELDEILTENTDGRKRRIFVKVRNIGFEDEEKEHEVEADHINDVIHSMFHHARKNGRHIHIDPLGKGHVKLTVHVKGATGKTRDEQIIHVKDWSL